MVNSKLIYSRKISVVTKENLSYLPLMTNCLKSNDLKSMKNNMLIQNDI